MFLSSNRVSGHITGSDFITSPVHVDYHILAPTSSDLSREGPTISRSINPLIGGLNLEDRSELPSFIDARKMENRDNESD